MRRIIYLLFPVTLMFLCSSAFTQSQFQTFVKALDNNGVLLNGGSTAAGHVNQIEIYSNSYGVSACPTPPCQAFQGDYSLLMSLNAATIKARQLLLKGLHLTSVDVYYHKTSALFDYYLIHMEDVSITSVQESASSEIPTISLSFTPTRIAWQYTATKSDGSAGTKTKGGWDFGTNTEWIFF